MIQTPLGPFEVRASALGNSGEIERARLQAVVPREPLPVGMSVAKVEAVILMIHPARLLKGLVFECVWTTPLCDGSPETGERLDAQSWSHDGHIVMVGTEDSEQLRRRLHHVALAPSPAPVELLSCGIRITIPRIEAEQRLSLHYAIACNRLPEPVGCSAWFAVDVPHDRLVQAIRT